MDLRIFFPWVDHDILMSRLAGKIKDKRLLKLICRYLEAEIVKGKAAEWLVKGMHARCHRYCQTSCWINRIKTRVPGTLLLSFVVMLMTATSM
ncbi:MAG: hypothetical protein ACTXOO_00895 [Sodalis sp. (in: enterobacteria)]